MKPVVSSLIALAIAIAPLSAVAATKGHHQKPVVAKVTKHHAKKSDKAIDKADKADEKEGAVVRVKHGKKGEAKPIVHHAHNVDLSGGGHKEPKVDHGVSVVPASLKTAHVKPTKGSGDLPKLPPNAAKPAKGGSEKGAKKATEKKHTDDSAKDGEPRRDEEFAELVARIKGRHSGNEKLAEENGEAEPDKKAKHGKEEARRCGREPVEVIRGPEFERFELMRCDGTIAPLAIEHLSILIRPGGAARPTTSVYELAKKKGPELAPGIKRVDPRLVERLQAVVDKFSATKSEKGSAPSPIKLSVISGYRPTSTGSMHATGRAIDFRIDNVKNEDVVAFCKTLADTGCGFYPNSSFVHLDVRDAGAGHVSWIDASGPGESPRYVSVWPPPPLAEGKASHHQDPPKGPLEHTSATTGTERVDKEAAPEPTERGTPAPASSDEVQP
jgi:hypothetical protein